MPRNTAIGRHYSGINVLILWGAVIEHGFPGQSWFTFSQALDGAALCTAAHNGREPLG
jgi:antirestriction protein ArdC